MLRASGLEKQAAKALLEEEKLARSVETLKGELEALTARQGELTGQALADFLPPMDESFRTYKATPGSPKMEWPDEMPSPK